MALLKTNHAIFSQEAVLFLLIYSIIILAIFIFERQGGREDDEMFLTVHSWPGMATEAREGQGIPELSVYGFSNGPERLK